MPTKKLIAKTAGTQDSFSNQVAGLGWGSTSINEATTYPHTALSQNYILLLSLYRSHWICRKVIDAVPEDMIKNWIKIEGQELHPEDIDQFERTVDDTQTIPAMLEGLQWGRLFGGGGCLIALKGQGGRLSTPLDLDSIEVGDYRGLIPFDRWSGIQPSFELLLDIEEPGQFGLPVYYTVTTQAGSQFKVHHSRILRFTGRKLPAWERYTVQGWGMSELELIYDELRKRDNTSYGIAQLVHRANLLVKHVPGLDAALSTGNQQQLQRMQNVISQQMATLNNQGMYVLNGGGPDEREDFDNHQYSFGGINDVYQTFLVEISGACEIPYSRLFGRTVTGLSQSNEGDEQIYYDMIAQKQKRELRPQLKKLLPVIAMSTWGQIPDDLDFHFAPMQEMNAKDKAELGKTRIDALAILADGGYISQRCLLEEVRAGQADTGIGGAITDDMIAAASEEANPVGEMQMLGAEEIRVTSASQSQPFRPSRRLEDAYLRSIRELIGGELGTLLANGNSLEMIAAMLQASAARPQFHEMAARLASRMVAGVSTANARSWRVAAAESLQGKRIYQLLKRELQEGAGANVEALVRENARLISSLPRQLAERATALVAERQMEGKRASEIARELRRLLPELTDSRIQLIARTEVGKAESALTQSRAQDLGMEWYLWRTSEDGRVRASHRLMDGVLVSWADPASPERLAGERSSLGRYHAGCAPNCRCVGLPMVDVQSVAWPRRVYVGGSLTRMSRAEFVRRYQRVAA